jgi:methylthioribose-1-phosphate isomerase
VKRTIEWRGDEVVVLDQTRLPHDVAEVRWATVEDAARGIESMQVRGAPLIGVAAAHGVALALAADPSDAGLTRAIDRLRATRPTAVNLPWALARCVDELGPRPRRERAVAARRLAQCLADDDVAICRRIGAHGLGLLGAFGDRPVNVLTHCNAGRLAAVEWGTALAPIYAAAEAGIAVHVWVSETRPRNQGAALTAWELAEQGVPHTVIADNAAGHVLRTGQVDLCLVGADRIAANGDVANKIGTYLKALAAHDNEVPFYVAAPTSTIDLATPDGGDIPIEERDSTEVTTLAGVRLVPRGSPARNWAFDVTPARLVTAVVTERGVLAPERLATV